jgi:hypothetical protein
MTEDERARLLALVEQWRARSTDRINAAFDLTGSGSGYAKQVARARADEAELCADELAARFPPVGQPEHETPAVHHAHTSASHPGESPRLVWCRAEKVWPPDGAAQQFDYLCTGCGEKITVNVSEFRAEAPVGQEAPQ